MDDDERVGCEAVYEVHVTVRDENFAMLPGCGDGRHGHRLIGCGEIGAQDPVRAVDTEPDVERG